MKPSEYCAAGVAWAIGGVTISFSLATVTQLAQLLAAVIAVVGGCIGILIGWRRDIREARRAELLERGAIFPDESEF